MIGPHLRRTFRIVRTSMTTPKDVAANQEARATMNPSPVSLPKKAADVNRTVRIDYLRFDRFNS